MKELLTNYLQRSAGKVQSTVDFVAVTIKGFFSRDRGCSSCFEVFRRRFCHHTAKSRNSSGSERNDEAWFDSNIAPASLPAGSKVNYYKDITRPILGRNLFNREGKVPVEKVEKKKEKEQVREFDIDAPCKKTTTRLKLIGTLALGERSSRAVMQAPGVRQRDHYKVGDFAYDMDGVQIAAIRRNLVILNNKGVKECISLGTAGMDELRRSKKKKKKAVPASHSVEVESDFVEAELGSGFQKIIGLTRIVPVINGGKTLGFKVFNIRSKLMKKIGFRSGDVITMVNDVSMRDPAKGFALFQALEEETDLKVKILRKNKPYTIKVRIE